MAIEKKEPTEEEYHFLYLAVDDFCKRGSTDIRCPRCQKQLIFQGNSSSFRISCEDKNCIDVIERGL